MSEVTPRLLREAGYKALRRMKAERDIERRRCRHLEAEVETLRSVIDLLKDIISKGQTQ